MTLSVIQEEALTSGRIGHPVNKQTYSKAQGIGFIRYVVLESSNEKAESTFNSEITGDPTRADLLITR